VPRLTSPSNRPLDSVAFTIVLASQVGCYALARVILTYTVGRPIRGGLRSIRPTFWVPSGAQARLGKTIRASTGDFKFIHRVCDSVSREL
jgi:hypothetical protein